MKPDLRVIACNYNQGISAVSSGSIAYVHYTNPGGGNDRIPLLVRSRSGRIIGKWEAMRRLDNFRFKTIPPEHPLYDLLSGNVFESGEDSLEYLRQACERERVYEH